MMKEVRPSTAVEKLDMQLAPKAAEAARTSDSDYGGGSQCLYPWLAQTSWVIAGVVGGVGGTLRFSDYQVPV